MAPSLIKRKIAVAAGKGGVGKSTCSVNLAWALAKKGYRVGLFDADVYGPSLVSLTNAQSADLSVDALIQPAIIDGVKVVSLAMFSDPKKPQILRGPMAANLLFQLFSKTEWGDLDYLIIDYPPGTGDIQLSLSQQLVIDAALMVTTPQAVACLDVRKAIEAFRTLKVPVIGIVENMSYFVCRECNARHEIFASGGGKRLAEETNLPLLAQIPVEEAISQGAERGKTLIAEHPESKTAAAFFDLAEKVSAGFRQIDASKSNRLSSFSLQWQ